MTDFEKYKKIIANDEKLKKEFAKAYKEKKLVDFFKTLGLETTEKEISEFLNSKKEQLNSSDLSKVSGGCGEDVEENGCDAFYSTVTFGVMCVAESIYYGIAQGSSCLKESSELL